MMWLLLLSLALVPLCTGDPDDSLKVEISINKKNMVYKKTRKVIITCEVTGLESDSLGRIRLIKLEQNDSRPIAQMTDMGKERLAKDMTMDVQRKIAESKNETSSLTVTFPIANRDVIGQFYCDAIVFKDSKTVIWKKSPELRIAKHEDTSDILAELGKEIRELIENRTDEGLVKKDCCQVPDDTSMLRLHLWPAGTFGLLQPEGGCPVDIETKWDSAGRANMTTESSRADGSTENNASDSINLQQPLFTTDAGKHFTNLGFCIKTEDGPGPITWPNGSYCLLKKNECPDGFEVGGLFMDLEDFGEENEYEETLPDGFFGRNAKLGFCCRTDGRAETPIALPTIRPFFLLRIGGVCQEVLCMNVSDQWIVIDTEDGNSIFGENIDEFNGVHPDGEINKVRLELCYYEKKQY